MDWHQEELNEHVRFIDYRGKTPPKVKDGIRLITAKNVKMGFINPEPKEFMDKNAFDGWMTRGTPHFGNVLFTTEAPLGNVAQLDTRETVVIGQRLITMQPDLTKIDPTFLKYLLMSPQTQSEIHSRATGATVLGIKAKLLKKLPICYPPLVEQQRIVAILDEAFAGIDAAIANTQDNLTSARELFESYLTSFFTQSTGDWTKVSLKDACSITAKLVDPKEAEFQDFPHIGAGNMVSKTGALENVLTARDEGLISGKFPFDRTMVLYSKIRPYLEKVCRPNFDGLCSADVYPLTPNPDYLTRDFLFYMLLSRHFTDYAVQGSGRAGMPKVNRTHLFKFTAKLPNIEKQSSLTTKLDELAKQTQRLEAIYQQKLNSLAELKHSILHKAFSGELTPQEIAA